MNRIFFTIALSCLLLFVGCSKERLTEESQWGNNTFSCKINGKVYVAQDDFLTKGIEVGIYHGTVPSTYDFMIGAHLYNNNNLYGTAILTLRNIATKGEYPISPTGSKAEIFIDNGGVANKAQDGKIVITRLDLSAKILSGNFEFVAVRDSDPDVNKLTITKGRFDVKF